MSQDPEVSDSVLTLEDGLEDALLQEGESSSLETFKPQGKIFTNVIIISLV